MHRVLFSFLALVALAGFFACGAEKASNDTPTDAYKRLFAAVKSKDIEAIKKEFTRKTIEFGATSAQRYGTQPEKMYENGFSATTFAASLPEIRDERVKDKMGAVEVWNSQESKWEDLPFMLEDGRWKLAMGEQFAGIYKLPSKGRDLREKEAANAVGNGPPVARGPVSNMPSANFNSNAGTQRPKQK